MKRHRNVFTQKRIAVEALAALKKMAAPKIHVLHDLLCQMVPSRDMVLGDNSLLEAGNFVPPDVRLLEVVNLKINKVTLNDELTLCREIKVSRCFNQEFDQNECRLKRMK